MIIDRFEGEYAICQTTGKDIKQIKKTDLPSDAKEGDVIIQNPDGSFFIDNEETVRLISISKKRLTALLKRSKTQNAQDTGCDRGHR